VTERPIAANATLAALASHRWNGIGSQSRWLLWTALLVALIPHTAGAQAAPPPACVPGNGTSAGQLACTLSNQLGPLTPPRRVVPVVPAASSPIVSPKVTELITRAVALRLGEGTQIEAPVAAREQTPSLPGAATIVYLQLSLTNGALQVTADAERPLAGLWRRTLRPKGHPIVHAFATVPVDPELQSLLGPVPLVASRVDRAPLAGQDIVSVGCTRRAADGGLAIQLVGRHQIQTVRLRHGELEPLARATWSSLAPVASTPLREPLAAVSAEGTSLLVATSDRARTLVLDEALAPKDGPSFRALPIGAGLCVPLDGLGLAGQATGCGSTAQSLAPWGGTLDGAAAARLLDGDGGVKLYDLSRPLGKPEILLRRDGVNFARFPGGAQFALGDLDRDGLPETVTTEATFDPRKDQVRVDSFDASGRAHRRWALPAPDGVSAVAICPAEDGGPNPVIVATRRELWVVR